MATEGEGGKDCGGPAEDGGHKFTSARGRKEPGACTVCGQDELRYWEGHMVPRWEGDHAWDPGTRKRR